MPVICNICGSNKGVGETLKIIPAEEIDRDEDFHICEKCDTIIEKAEWREIVY